MMITSLDKGMGRPYTIYGEQQDGDWDLPEMPDANHHSTSITAEHTENWDDF